MTQSEAQPRAAVLTVSDAGSRGERVDTAGPVAADLLREAGFEVATTEIVADEPEQIAAQLRRWADDDGYALVVTTGGTGLGPRDRTPEATTAVCDYLVPGIGEAMRAASLPITQMAMISRAVAGVRARTLIVNLPGSEGGARDNLRTVLPVLHHAVTLLRGQTGHGS
jgi:molybdenum cofactor synthesis domain-containing protein